jgi:hypothetical protein
MGTLVSLFIVDQLDFSFIAPSRRGLFFKYALKHCGIPHHLIGGGCHDTKEGAMMASIYITGDIHGITDV